MTRLPPPGVRAACCPASLCAAPASSLLWWGSVRACVRSLPHLRGLTVGGGTLKCRTRPTHVCLTPRATRSSPSSVRDRIRRLHRARTRCPPQTSTSPSPVFPSKNTTLLQPRRTYRAQHTARPNPSHRNDAIETTLLIERTPSKRRFSSKRRQRGHPWPLPPPRPPPPLPLRSDLARLLAEGGTGPCLLAGAGAC